MNRSLSRSDLVVLLACVVIMMGVTFSASGDDLDPPPWPRLGAANYTTSAEWEFFGPTSPPGTPYDADGTEVPLIIGDGFGGFTPQVLPSGDIAWVPYDGDGGYLGGALGTGPGALNFRVTNWIDKEPLKIIRMQMTYEPGPVGLAPFIEFIIPTDATDPITSVAMTGVTDGPIVGDPGGRWHRLETWEIKPNPDFESIQVIVPEGVLIDQVVIDTISTVPEPGSLALMALGGLAVVATRRRSA